MNKKPFGEADCESEMKDLRSDYTNLYFDETPFNSASIDASTYLIIGRRGSGKTALAQYFSFQKALPNPIFIFIDNPSVYQDVLSKVALKASDSREIAIPKLIAVWEYVIWCVIFEHTQKHSSAVANACKHGCNHTGPSGLVNSIIDQIHMFLSEAQDDISGIRLNHLLGDAEMAEAKEAVMDIAKRHPIIVVLDTLERYDINNVPLMNAIAALVQFSAHFSQEYRDSNIHIKVLMSGEVFPHLEENVLQNPLKNIKDPVYLFWRPKDLLRLISWRFYRFLKREGHFQDDKQLKIDWTNHKDVLHKMWIPYFGESVTNFRGNKEHSFSYVLRHTQMRPRQLILLCNAISERSMSGGRFPRFSERDIRDGVKGLEDKLAKEVLSSFVSIYPQVGLIIDALSSIPFMFEGKELDRRASQSASDWPAGTYSSANFRRLVAELGVVGRVRKRNGNVIEADFEYALAGRLPLSHRDVCVIHPMYYTRLNVDFNLPLSSIQVPGSTFSTTGSEFSALARVMPFSTQGSREEDDGLYI